MTPPPLPSEMGRAPDLLSECVLIGLVVALADVLLVLDGQKRWAVVCADNSVVLPMLPEKSVAHVVTDPPYEAEAHTLARRQRSAGVVDVLAIEFAPIGSKERAAVAREIVRLSAGWALAFCQVEAIAAWRESFTAAGAKWVRGQAWVKPDSAPQFTGDRPAQGYECIATAWAGVGRMAWNGGGKRGVYIHEIGTHGGEKNPHPTTKPLPLMLELAELFTDPDELVLDPFAGSGTTGVACLRLGRRFIGIERDTKYATVARERLQAEERGQSLREFRAGQQSLFADFARAADFGGGK